MTTAIYAGTFDPFTFGHRTIVEQGIRLFSHVRILIAVNPNKTCTFSVEERIKIIKSYVDLIPNVSIDYTDGYVVEYAKECGATVLLRGIRHETDSLGELKLAQENLKLAPTIQTVILPTDPSLSDISSYNVKKMIFEGGAESYKKLVPKYVNSYTHSMIVSQAHL